MLLISTRYHHGGVATWSDDFYSEKFNLCCLRRDLFVRPILGTESVRVLNMVKNGIIFTCMWTVTRRDCRWSISSGVGIQVGIRSYECGIASRMNGPPRTSFIYFFTIATYSSLSSPFHHGLAKFVSGRGRSTGLQHMLMALAWPYVFSNLNRHVYFSASTLVLNSLTIYNYCCWVIEVDPL